MLLRIKFEPFPELSTERLFLRRISMADADEMFLYRSDKELMRYIPHRLAGSKREVEALIEEIKGKADNKEAIHWAITLKGSNTILGTVGFVRINDHHLRAELGYMLHTPQHGKGVMEEACRAVIDYGFNVMKLHSIEAIVNHENIASKKLLTKLGFSNDAYFKDYLYLGGRFIDANVYSLITPVK